MKMMSCDWQWR